jgi:CRP-like cAMP-binding protein
MAETLFGELNLLARIQPLPAGAVLFRRNESSHSVFVVHRGNIALLWPDAEEATPMEVLGPGTIIGLPAALNGTYSVTAKTILDSEVGVIGVVQVLELLESRPGLCRTAMRMMGQEVARMRSLIAEHCTQLYD